MNVGVVVVADNNEGDVLIKVEVCDRKKRGNVKNDIEQREKDADDGVVNSMCYPPANAGIRTMVVVEPSRALPLSFTHLPVLAYFESAFPCSFNFDVRMAAMRSTGLGERKRRNCEGDLWTWVNRPVLAGWLKEGEKEHDMGNQRASARICTL